MESYQIVFELFDRDHSGFIDEGDLRQIAQTLGRDPDESKFLLILMQLVVIKLVEGFDCNQDQKISFNEFVNVMKNLESRLNYENPNVIFII